ncbi:MCM family protein [Heterostelium album PN500]|uniref:DNA helicase n=1 Tax=Heterostelium pallidum (strain ATCC 26659 / Pp 5 / PN500) TaxID=670386 RepID=D3B157_HETP5|nr:MCM family protein [Heterostelium album PN500]EFA85031.1 MCM family protein [Heterostelium album PN500]|eukprot:XP_020437141.1 MCM family protein [Heterostelium album PN500]
MNKSNSSSRGGGGGSYRGRGKAASSTTTTTQQNGATTDANQRQDKFYLRKIYDQDYQKCLKFLQEFKSSPSKDGSIYDKYMIMMKEVFDRKRKLFEIELEDVFRFTNDRDFVRRIETNTMSYIRLFTSALEELMPEPDFTTDSIQSTIGESSDSVIDLIMAHRAKNMMANIDAAVGDQPPRPNRSLGKDGGGATTGGANAKKRSAKKNEHLNVLPPDLLRRFELLIVPRVAQQFKPTKIREIRSEHIGCLITLEGIVTRVTDVKPMVTVAAYTCDTCNAEWFQEVTSREFMPIIKCNSAECYNNSRDTNKIGSLTLQSRGSNTGKVRERSDWTYSTNYQGTSPGDLVTLFGVFLPTPYTGHKAIRAGLLADTYVEAMRIVQHKKTYEQYQMTPEMEEAIKEIEDSDIYERLAMSIAPEIYGHLDVKKALLLQMVGAAVKKMPDGMSIRGDINICLMGDPGVAKSQLLKHIAKIAPRGIYTSGKGSSGVGLTAAVIKDSVTGDYVLEGGSLVLADMGICCIDEFDKMEDADRTAIHEVMEQQTISIAKAGITTTLNARTSVLAAANPAFGRYNFNKKPDENFNLPPSLLSRFDLLFLIVDRPDLELDRLLSEHVTFVHQNSKPPELKTEVYEPEFIRCFVSRARKYEPYVPPQLTEFIVESYVTMRKQEADQKVPLTYTTARTLLGILRLAQARARCRFSETVAQSDVEEAMRLMWVSKASIRTDQKKKRVDPITSIYALIRDTCKKHSSSKIQLPDMLKMVLTAGFTQNQFNRCLSEYQEMGLLMVNDDKSSISVNTSLEHSDLCVVSAYLTAPRCTLEHPIFQSWQVHSHFITQDYTEVVGDTKINELYFPSASSKEQVYAEAILEHSYRETVYCFLTDEFIVGQSKICPDKDTHFYRWSDPAIWGGQLPQAHYRITISERVLLDVSPPPLFGIEIDKGGLLVFEDVPGITLTTGYITLSDGGALVIGSDTCPYQNKVTITLTGHSESIAPNITLNGISYGQKVIAVAAGGTLELHGAIPPMTRTVLVKTAMPGNNFLDVLHSVCNWWKPGDHLLLGSTDYDVGQTEMVEIDSCLGSQIKLTNPLKYMHYGEITLGSDQRADVLLFTRNIVIEGSQESQSCVSNSDLVCAFFPYYTFGGHIMITRGYTSVSIDGVELYNMGQQHSESKRFPIHFYKVGQRTATYVRNSVIHRSFSRCIVLSGTDSLTIKNNYAYDHIGHCFMLHDGMEMWNSFEGNVGVLTKHGLLTPSDRNCEMCLRVKPYDFNGETTSCSECNSLATFWFANPYNMVIGNTAGGSENMGISYVFPEYPTGDSRVDGKERNIRPIYLSIWVFENNTCHSNRIGLHVDGGLKLSEPSKSEPQQLLSAIKARYRPQLDPTSNSMRIAMLRGLHCFKNRWRGAWARGGNMIFKRCVFADNAVGLTVASDEVYPYDQVYQQVTNCLFVGETRNLGHALSVWWNPSIRNRTNPYGDNGNMPVKGFEFYQGPISMWNCTFRSFVKDNSTAARNISALSWYRYHDDQFSPLSVMSNINYENVTHRFLQNAQVKDGDKCQNIRDGDGSSTGIANSVILPKSEFYQHDTCRDYPLWNAQLCTTLLSYLYIKNADTYHSQFNGKTGSAVVVKDFFDSELKLTGLPNSYYHYHFLALVFKDSDYTIHFDTHPTPPLLIFEAIGWDAADSMNIGVCIGINNIQSIRLEKMKGDKILYEYQPSSMVPVANTSPIFDQYHYSYDRKQGIVYFNLHQNSSRPTSMTVCPIDGGCEQVRLNVTYSPGVAMATGDCRTHRYKQFLSVYDESVTYPLRISNQSVGVTVVNGDAAAVGSNFAYRGRNYLSLNTEHLGNRLRFECKDKKDCLFSAAHSHFEVWIRGTQPSNWDTPNYLSISLFNNNNNNNFNEQTIDCKNIINNQWSIFRISMKDLLKVNNDQIYFDGIQFNIVKPYKGIIYLDDIKLLYLY